jgi:uncharacterized protein (DUF433 family)/DNA-binding transcriptional MerR regulator
MTNLVVAYKPRIGEGVYTIPDAAQILDIPKSKLRRWVNGYRLATPQSQERVVAPVVDAGTWGDGRQRGFNFYTLIELYTITALRDLGVSFMKIKKAREELEKRFRTKYPFATQKLMSDGRQILVEFSEGELSAVLELGTDGQMALAEIIRPFCKKLEFNAATNLVELYRPMGKDTSIIVSPHHGFGRPTIEGTNIASETLYKLILAGEDKNMVAELYDITPANIDDIIAFERRVA